MNIQVEEQKIQVSDTAPTVDVNPANNAGAIIISGKELDALPDDPDELLTDLQALAGPSAGPNGGQLYIDGFTAGQLPPSHPFVRSALIRIRSRRNTTSSATAASKSSPSLAPTNTTASFRSAETIRHSIRPIRSREQSPAITRPSTREVSAAPSIRSRHFLSAPSTEPLTISPPSTPKLSTRTSIPFRPWSPFPRRTSVPTSARVWTMRSPKTTR